MEIAKQWRKSIKVSFSYFFVTLETRRRLGQVYFRKDFRDCYYRDGKNWPIADQRLPSNDPRNNCRTHFDSSSLLVSKVTNLRSNNHFTQTDIRSTHYRRNPHQHLITFASSLVQTREVKRDHSKMDCIGSKFGAMDFKFFFFSYKGCLGWIHIPHSIFTFNFPILTFLALQTPQVRMSRRLTLNLTTKRRIFRLEPNLS